MVHMFVSIPPNLSVSDLLRKMKGRSSHQGAAGIPAVEKALLGQAILGQGILFND
jgi:putative transposase